MKMTIFCGISVVKSKVNYKTWFEQHVCKAVFISGKPSIRINFRCVTVN